MVNLASSPVTFCTVTDSPVRLPSSTEIEDVSRDKMRASAGTFGWANRDAY